MADRKSGPSFFERAAWPGYSPYYEGTRGPIYTPYHQVGESMGLRYLDEKENEEKRAKYSGRGPKGYQRTDDRIYEDVCERLTWDHLVDASDVEVEVKDQVVTLKGSIATRTMKYLAEDIAHEVRGVRDVRNELRVPKGSESNSTYVSSGMMS